MKKQKGIYLRGKIYWIRYAGVDGRIIRESTGSTNKEAAERLPDFRGGNNREEGPSVGARTARMFGFHPAPGGADRESCSSARVFCVR